MSIEQTDNDDRAEWADKAVRAFVSTLKLVRAKQGDEFIYAEDKDAIPDLICDLCHLAAKHGQDPMEQVRRAIIMYVDERDYPPSGWVPNEHGRTRVTVQITRGD